MGDSDSGYQFGSGMGEDEVARLEIHGRALAPATRMIFAEAGIRPGIRVLNLGDRGTWESRASDGLVVRDM
jgi:hypothetical protein